MKDLQPSGFKHKYQKNMSANVTSNMHHFQHSKSLPKLLTRTLPIYITMDSHHDYGFNILCCHKIYSYNTYIVVFSIVDFSKNMCYVFYPKTSINKTTKY